MDGWQKAKYQAQKPWADLQAEQMGNKWEPSSPRKNGRSPYWDIFGAVICIGIFIASVIGFIVIIFV